MFGINDSNKGVDLSADEAQLESAVASAMQASPPPAAGTDTEVPAVQNSGVPSPTPILDKPLAQVAPPPDHPIMSAPPPSSDDELLGIKQEALNNLAPLVSKLDQSPEEKFKTTMMLMQASDNPALVKEAYAAANQIKDEKARAQALLDVVNEINYFTHSGAA